MPSLKIVRPLLKLCLDSIEKSIRNNGFAADVTVPVYSFDMIALFENNKNDVNEPNSTWISSLTSVEEEMKKNPFFQLCKFLLRLDQQSQSTPVFFFKIYMGFQPQIFWRKL